MTDILDKEKAEQKRVAELERVNRMKTLALRREWTTSLFRENMSDERMEEISVYCELFLDSPWYFLCAVRPDDMDSLPDADRELAAFSFQNAMEDFCGDGAACFAIGENAACYYLRGFDVPPSEEEQRQLAETIRGRLYKLRGVFRCPLSAAAALVDDRHRIASCTALLDGWLARAGDDAVRLFSAGELCACPAAAGEEGPEPEEEERAATPTSSAWSRNTSGITTRTPSPSSRRRKACSSASPISATSSRWKPGRIL